MGWFADHLGLAAAVAAGSLAVFLAGLWLARRVVVALPEDYFCRPRGAGTAWGRRHPLARGALVLAKNVLGLGLAVLGVVLALPFTPGPGTLVFLLGVSLLDFPGKRVLEQRLASLPVVRRGLNRIRARAGRPPLRLPEPPAKGRP
jgi:hypothetical protein